MIRLFKCHLHHNTNSIEQISEFNGRKIETADDIQRFLEWAPEYHVIKVTIADKFKDVYVIWTIDPQNI